MSQFLIYCKREITTRLSYVLEWIFKEQLFSDFEITNDKAKFLKAEGLKLNYSNEDFDTDILKIIPATLLFEKNIRKQDLAIREWRQTPVLFYNQSKAELPFDMFAAIFYLISRYEEYLPHDKDRHGRFAAEQSAAMNYHFIDRPVVDEWIVHFRTLLSEKFQAGFKTPQFGIQHTFDVDLAWKYLHKGRKRLISAYLKDFFTGKWQQIKERSKVLSGKIPDPYFSFPHLKELNKTQKAQPLFFILLGKLSAYDRNADPESQAMQELMKELSQHYICGIHPSYGSHKSLSRLKKEIALLSAAIQQPVTKSRQHYIKFSLPETYRNLVTAGIKEDYSMGYASVNGFRAGTSRSFLWYDLKAEKIQDLRIHPFVFMDATSKYYLKHNAERTFKEWLQFYKIIQKTNGCFVSVWHNFILHSGSEKDSWLNLYRKTITFNLSRGY